MDFWESLRKAAKEAEQDDRVAQWLAENPSITAGAGWVPRLVEV